MEKRRYICATKLPHHKSRCEAVDDEIERLYLAGEAVFRIARIIPIGDRYVRNCIKERGLIKPCPDESEYRRIPARKRHEWDLHHNVVKVEYKRHSAEKAE